MFFEKKFIPVIYCPPLPGRKKNCGPEVAVENLIIR